MKRVLITGASGFIGSHLVEEGLERDYEVFAGVRKTSSRKYLGDPRIRFLETDLAHPEHLSVQMNHCRETGIRFHFIIHNAGLTRASSKAEFFRVNDQLTRNLVDALEATGMVPDKFLFISSLAAVGPGDPVTMKPVTDDTLPHPMDTYGRSKRAAELFLGSRPRFPWLVIRPTGIYGPRDRDYLTVYRTIQRGWEPYMGSSGQRISFLYIRDLTRMVYTALTSGHVHKTWIASDGGNYPVREFLALLKRILDRKTVPLVLPLPVVRLLALVVESAARPFGRAPLLNREKAAIMGSMNWQCDPSALFRDLGFTPEFDLEKGLTETIRWCREQKLL